MKYTGVYGNSFCGHTVSEYGQKEGFVDYSTFAKAFDAVLANEFIETTSSIGYWEMVQDGCPDYAEEMEQLEHLLNNYEESEAYCFRLVGERDEYTSNFFDDSACYFMDKQEETGEQMMDLDYQQNEPPEIYQWFIVDSYGAEIIENWSNDPLFYNEALDLYVWGVTHWGTSWDYVLTDIRCNTGTFNGV